MEQKERGISDTLKRAEVGVQTANKKAGDILAQAETEAKKVKDEAHAVMEKAQNLLADHHHAREENARQTIEAQKAEQKK